MKARQPAAVSFYQTVTPKFLPLRGMSLLRSMSRGIRRRYGSRNGLKKPSHGMKSAAICFEAKMGFVVLVSGAGSMQWAFGTS
jgi:hypothetical protein